MSHRYQHCDSCKVSFNSLSKHNCEMSRIAAALERIATVMEFVPVLTIPDSVADDD